MKSSIKNRGSKSIEKVNNTIQRQSSGQPQTNFPLQIEKEESIEIPSELEESKLKNSIPLSSKFIKFKKFRLDANTIHKKSQTIN